MGVFENLSKGCALEWLMCTVQTTRNGIREDGEASAAASIKANLELLGWIPTDEAAQSRFIVKVHSDTCKLIRTNIHRWAQVRRRRFGVCACACVCV